jgi:aminocarboxymuconate-semialdehyde decarboxylase
MFAIDVHAHIVRLEALAEMYRVHPDLAHELVELEEGHHLRYPNGTLAPIPTKMFDIDERLAAMDRQRVDIQILAIQPRQYHYNVPPQAGADMARIQNDANIDLSDLYPDRFHVFLTLPLQDLDAALRELARVGSHPRVRGIQIGTNINGQNLDGPHLAPLWEALVNERLPVWIHPSPTGMTALERLGSYGLVNLIGNPLESTIAIASLIFGGVLEQYPSLLFGFVHGGGFAPYQTGRWDHGWENRANARAVIARPPTDYFKRMFFDSLTHDRESLRLLGERVGWQQVVIGTDYPFIMGEADPVGAIEELGLPAEAAAAVLGENAARFLRPVGDG